MTDYCVGQFNCNFFDQFSLLGVNVDDVIAGASDFGILVQICHQLFSSTLENIPFVYSRQRILTYKYKLVLVCFVHNNLVIIEVA
jgi:hypothetical protein